MKKSLSILLILMIFGKSFGQPENKNQQKDKNDNSSVNNTRISAGASGVKRSISYRFTSGSAESDPGNGRFSLDKINISEVKYLVADNIDMSGEDQSQWFSTWDDTTGATGRGQILLVDTETDKTTVLDVTGVFSHQDGFWKIPVTFVSGSYPENGKIYYYIFNRIARKKTGEAESTPITAVTQTQVPEPETIKQSETPEQEPEVTPVAVVTPQPQVPEEKTVQPVVAETKPEPEAVPVTVVTSQPQVTEEKTVQPVVTETKPEPEAVPVTVVTPQPQVPEEKTVQPVVTETKPEPEAVPVTVVTPQPQVPEEKTVQPVVTETKPEPEAMPVTVVTPQPQVPEEKIVQPVVTETKPEPEAVPVTVITPQPQVPEEKTVQPVITETKPEPEAVPITVVTPQPQVPEEKTVQPVVTATKPEPEAAPVIVVSPQPQAAVQEKKEEPVVNTQPLPVSETKREPVITENRPAVIPDERLAVREDRRRPADKSTTEDQNIEERVTQVSTVRQPAAQPPQPQPSAQPSSQPVRQPEVQPSPVTRQAETVTETKTVKQETNAPAQQSSVAQPAQQRVTTQVTSVPDQRNEGSAPPSYQPNLPVYQPAANPYAAGRGHGKCYSGIIEAGYGLGIGEYGMDNFRFNFINGFHIGPTFTVGLGLGLRKYFPESYTDRTLFSKTTRMPVFLDLRKRFSTKTVTPYMSFGIGNTISFIKEQDSTRSVNDGVMINASGGIWLNLSQRFGVFAGIAYESEKFEYVWISDDSHFKKNGGSISINIGISF